MSEYRTYLLNENEIDIWDEYVDKSENGTIFHKYEWLKIAEEHTGMRLFPVAVYKGNSLVCLFPLFYQKRYGYRIILSPPNGCAIPHLGPVLIISASNRYNYEKTYIDIIDEILLFAEQKVGFDYVRIINTPELFDMRPYIWKKYKVKPNYTYIFDLKITSDEIFYSFHSSTKNAIRKTQKNTEISISYDRKYLYDTLSMVRIRYSDQNRKFKISDRYIEKLLNGAFTGNIESTTIMLNGNILAGTIDLSDGKNVYGWIGSVKRNGNISGGGEFLLWEKIKEYQNRGYTSYDIVGANTRHLCNHKAKYGARLVPYFVIDNSSGKGKIGLELMKLTGKANYD